MGVSLVSAKAAHLPRHRAGLYALAVFPLRCKTSSNNAAIPNAVMRIALSADDCLETMKN